MTRTNAPFPTSPVAPSSSSTLTGMLAIQSLHLCSFEMVFVNHNTDAAAATIFEAAHDSATAVDLHVLPRAYYLGWQQNREVHHRPDRNIIVHRKQNAVGGDVFRLRRKCAALRLNRRRKMDRKSRGALHLFEMPRVGLRLGHRCLALCCHSANNLPAGNAISAPRTHIELKGSLHLRIDQTKLPKSWNKWG